MQDRYTGDIGDYIKYGLLRALAKGRRLGVAWYLFPDEAHNADGRHIDYLQDVGRWRSSDPALYDALKGIVQSGRRKVSDIEESGVLQDARFSGELLNASDLTPAQRRNWRASWFENVQKDLQGCDVVFADPDNGLCDDEKFRPGRKKDWKRIPLSEARTLAAGKTAVIYHHNSRYPGGHGKEISDWMGKLGPNTLALRWRAFGSRTFFIMNPTPDMYELLETFSDKWGAKAELHSR